jgi:hypothetical protein
MTKATDRKPRALKPVDGGGETTPKSKRARSASKPTTFAGQLRELAAAHRKKLSKLTDAESKLEAKLAIVREQREAAEGPLRRVEEMLADHPELPGTEEHEAEELPDAVVNQ